MSKVVFVTGAASGIGKQIGTTFLKQGYTVVFSDVNKEALGSSVAALREDGFEAHGIVCDVTDEEQINAAIDETVEKYGRLDVLINNAGFQYVSMIEDFPTSRFDLMTNVMLRATFIAVKRAVPIMKKQGFGRILNMGSVNAVIGFAGKVAYNSNKHAILGLTRVIALETAPFGITVNAICPGYVDTPLVRGQIADLAKSRNIPVESALDEAILNLVPQKRLIDVQEIADLAIYLASDSAKAITGQPILIDGGYTAQ